MTSLAPWRSLLDSALDSNSSLPYSRYLQLATVRVDGKPANRTVVFRGFLENTDQMQFVVDARSEKTEQIEHQPWGEACWYFPDSREQFRFTGLLTLIGANHPHSALAQARQTSWRQLSDSARLQYAWPHPGEPRADAAAFEPPPPNAVEPLPHFCLLLMAPVQVDRLTLRGEPQNRTLYCCSDAQEWSVREINP